MTIDHLDFEMLSAFADHELAGAALLRAETHLAGCASCRDSLARVRALVQSAASLPREMAPPAEAWEGITARARARPQRGARAVWRAASIAAAAVLVFAAGAMVLRPGRSGKVRAPQATPVVPAALTRVDRNYEASIAELRLTLEQQRHTLSPATMRIVERSIAVIDSAIAEARGALASDPGNRELPGILSAQYGHKVELLQRATKLSPST